MSTKRYWSFDGAVERSISDYVHGWRKAAEDLGVADQVIDRTLTNLADQAQTGLQSTSKPLVETSAQDVAVLLAEILAEAKFESLPPEPDNDGTGKIRLAEHVLTKLEKQGFSIRREL